MQQRKLIQRLFGLAMVTGLLVTSKLVSVRAQEGQFILTTIDNIQLAQAENLESSQNLISDLEKIEQLVIQFEAKLETLNTDLKKVVNKEIDREAVDFQTLKDELEEINKAWRQFKEQYTTQLPQSSQDLIIQIDNNLESFKAILSPLNKDIIQSLTEFQKKQKDKAYQISSISELTDYQKQLFGEQAKPEDTDGIFGVGTQSKIELETTKYIGDLKYNISELENSILKESFAALPKEELPKEEQVKEESKEASEASTTATNKKSPLLFLLFLGLIGSVVLAAYLTSKSNLRNQRKILEPPEQLRPKEKPEIPKQKINQTPHRDHSEKIVPSLFIEPPKSPIPVTKPTQTSSKTYTTKTIDNVESINIKNEDDLVTLYNKNPKALLDKVIVVTATEESLDKQRAGYDFPIIFEEASIGNYWILPVPQEAPYYFLIPKGHLVINPNTYRTVRDIFKCIGYENRTSNKFILKSAAVVTYNQSSEFWIFYELGELIFN